MYSSKFIRGCFLSLGGVERLFLTLFSVSPDPKSTSDPILHKTLEIHLQDISSFSLGYPAHSLQVLIR